MAPPRFFIFLVGAIVATGIAVACAGPDLPNAPDVPHVENTLPSASPGETPAPFQTLPPAPHGGQIDQAGGGYLEFLAYPENGRSLYFIFPYDAQLSGLQKSTVGAQATLTIDGTPQTMTAALDTQGDGSLFFYVYPHLSGSTHQIEASVTVAGTTYTGSFTDP